MCTLCDTHCHTTCSVLPGSQGWAQVAPGQTPSRSAGRHTINLRSQHARSGPAPDASGPGAVLRCAVPRFRYNIAADMVESLLPDLRAAAASAPESLAWPPPPAGSGGGAASQGVAAIAGLVAVTVWLRFSSLRLLTWNHNYNVKPREISAALDRLGANLVQVCWALQGTAALRRQGAEVQDTVAGVCRLGLVLSPHTAPQGSI